MSERIFDGVWIPAELWFTKEINLTEKIILLEIRSLDNEYGCIATNKKIGEVLNLKANTVSSIIKSLHESGYIKITYKDYNTFDGRCIELDYTRCSEFFTPPKKSKGTPPEKSKGLPEKSIHSNIISNYNIVSKDTIVGGTLSPKEKCDFFIKKFNEIRGSKYQATDKVCASLNRRIKKYKAAQIFAALRNAMKSEYHTKTKYKDLTPEFILREDKLEKYLNCEESATLPSDGIYVPVETN